MKSTDLLEQLAKARGLRSDYAIAKYLGLSRSRVSSYRHGVTIGPELALRIADDIGLDRGYVLASIAGERAKGNVKAAWSELAKKAAAIAAAVFVVTCGATLLSIDDQAAASTASSMYIMSNALALWLALYLLLAARLTELVENP